MKILKYGLAGGLLLLAAAAGVLIAGFTTGRQPTVWGLLVRHEYFENPHLKVPVIRGLYPVQENSAVIRRRLGGASDAALAARLLTSGDAEGSGSYLDVIRLEKWADFSARKIQTSCEKAAVEAESLRSPGEIHRPVEAGGASWATVYDPGVKSLEYRRCEAGILWRMTYWDRRASGREDLAAWSLPNVESAALRRLPPGAR